MIRLVTSSDCNFTAIRMPRNLRHISHTEELALSKSDRPNVTLTECKDHGLIVYVSTERSNIQVLIVKLRAALAPAPEDSHSTVSRGIDGPLAPENPPIRTCIHTAPRWGI